MTDRTSINHRLNYITVEHKIFFLPINSIMADRDVVWLWSADNLRER